MGNEYEVLYWDADKQELILVWDGDDALRAIEEMNTLKSNGKKCIHLVWRP